METKENKKKILINLALFVTIIIGCIIIFSNVAEPLEAEPTMSDKDIANKALSNPKEFLGYDYNKNPEVNLHIGNGNSDATIWKSTAACVDPDHNADGNFGSTYRIQAIVDIDNKYNTKLSDWTGLNVTVPKGAVYGSPGTQQRITNTDIVTRARFLAGWANWMLHGNSGIQDTVSTSQSKIDGWFSANFFVFCNYAKSHNAVFNIMAGSQYKEYPYTGNNPAWQNSSWQVVGDYQSVYEEARTYAESRKNGVGGVTNISTKSPEISYEGEATIIGPYTLGITGSAKVSGITVETASKKYTTSNVKILNSSKKEIEIGAIANKQDFYIKINEAVDEIKSIKLTTTGDTVHATRILLFAGGNNQRIAIFNNENVEGGGSLNLKVPPAKPIIVKYKYVKSIQRKQRDGTYKTLFTVNEVPTLEVSNKGKNNAKVTKVNYPDYKKYCNKEDVDENGIPYVYTGDLVEYQWVIYNIGPGNSSPGTKVKLVDEPEAGLKLQEGKSNGWTKSGNTYTKTITLNSSLKGFKGSTKMQHYKGQDTMIYFEISGKDKANSSQRATQIIKNNGVPVRLTFRLEGIVFKDNLAQKDGREDGILSTGDDLLENIEVELFNGNGKSVATATTNGDGWYEFDKLDITQRYFVSFKYNGQLYEPTTYQTLKKYSGSGNNKVDTAIKERSYATDGEQNRNEFNNKFAIVDKNHNVPPRDDVDNEAFMITAYTGSNGKQSLKTYNLENTEEELLNVNFGIKDREQFDLNLRKDLVKVDVQINGKGHTYEYNGAGEDLEVNIRGTDVPSYERKLRKSDLQYKAQDDTAKDKLHVYVTYKLQIKNQSVGKLTGYVLDLNDYADTSYELVKSYDENDKEIHWNEAGTISGNGKTYKKMNTTDLAQTGITDKKWIFMQYKVSNDTLREVLQKGETLEENYAEIAGYKNTYTEDRYDLNNKKITNAGQIAGLIDIDSVPDNMNPTDSKVQSFVKESKTEAYQSLSGEEKTKRSRAVFEDDADVAPALKLIRDDVGRSMTGVVFEDSPLQSKLNNNERIGDGEYQTNENIVNQVKVELICTNNEDVNSLNKIEKRTNEDGSYTLSNFIPGDYLIKFTYGDYECLINPQQDDKMYTGQDFKSTIYDESIYKDKYWYSSSAPRKSDAKDDYSRREVVNSYSKDYKYDIATVLNAKRGDTILVNTLAEKTNMFADTAEMSMEVEYLKNEKQEYKVQNVDFGIVERPRTKIILEKEVSNVKLIATDGVTIFNAEQKAPNLTWEKNKYDRSGKLKAQGLIQGTVDENLLYGSTLNVSYKLKITNNSEKDYNETSYYYKGKVANPNTLNKIETTSVIEYVPTMLQYSTELTKNKGTVNYGNKQGNAIMPSKNIAGSNNLWEVIASRIEKKELPSDYKGILLEPGAFDEAKANLDEVLITKLNGVNTKLGIDEYIELKDILTFTRVIARPEDTSDKEEIQNIAEIIRLNIDNGRRPYYKDTTNREIIEIPGNTYPHTLRNIEEIDTARSEILTFVVPFGKDKQITLIIVIIASLTILITGIIVIKKKVL